MDGKSGLTHENKKLKGTYMKQNEEPRGTLYFAYGSNMDKGQMNVRCPNSSLVGSAVLLHYQFIINQRGYATIIPRHSGIVHGVLWHLSPEDEQSLDQYEGCDVGLYAKCERPVRVNGKVESALVYIDYRNTALGTPRREYMGRIIEAATMHHLPEEYQQMLRAWKDGGCFTVFEQVINQYKSLDKRFEQSWGEVVEAEREIIILDMLHQYGHDINFMGDRMRRYMSRRLEMWKEEQEVHELGRHANRKGYWNAMKESFDAIREEIRRKEYEDARTHGDLGTAGVIITSDPNRNHGREDRVVVTEHANALEWLWRRIFFEGNTGISTSRQIIGLFADVAEKHCMEDDPQGLLIDVVDSVELTVKTEQERESL